MRWLRLTLAYDGTEYGGWQRQPNAVTIQAKLELALRRVTGEDIKTEASGRTDAGVHARGLAVSWRTESTLPNETLRRAVNAYLPEDICVLAVEDAPRGYHAIRDTVRKRYRYCVQAGPLRDVFQRYYVWHVWHTLDVEAMRKAARTLVGRHDFASFQTAGSQRKTTVRTVFDLTLEESTNEFGQHVTFEIEADGFLYNMVRNIVGTLVEVGRGKHPPEWVEEVLERCDRRAAGPTAPPQGLTLLWVK